MQVVSRPGFAKINFSLDRAPYSDAWVERRLKRLDRVIQLLGDRIGIKNDDWILGKAFDIEYRSLCLRNEGKSTFLKARCLEAEIFSKKYPREAKDILEEALEEASKLQDANLQLFIMNRLSRHYFQQGNYKITLEWAKKLLNISENLNDKYYQAEALNRLGACYGTLGSHEEALKYLLACFQLASKINYPNICYVLNNIGLVWNEQQQPNSKGISIYRKHSYLRKNTIIPMQSHGIN
ncbi:MAG: tetratricopeptide repeat protein [Deinococcales bacterium]